MAYKILSVNPGSTSTKVALYEDERELFTAGIIHSTKEIAVYEKIREQLAFRLNEIRSKLEEESVDYHKLSAVVGRGGMLPPVHGGGYLVNQAMINLLLGDQLVDHASNLGGLIAYDIARPLRIPAYIYDAVSSDELSDWARITGIPEINRQSFCHVLNSKAMGRKYAKKRGGKYEDYNLLIAHLGGGISISAHQKGKIVDVVSDDGGPFSPERSGSVPLGYIVNLCYSGLYSKKEIMKKIRGGGGLKAHLGTSDCEEVEEMIALGDSYAELIYQAMGYQIAKGIGNICTVFDGPIDAIILTGGIAYSPMITTMIRQRVEFIAPVVIMPGENEMESLTLGALRILRGEEKAREL